MQEPGKAALKILISTVRGQETQYWRDILSCTGVPLVPTDDKNSHTKKIRLALAALCLSESNAGSKLCHHCTLESMICKHYMRDSE